MKTNWRYKLAQIKDALGFGEDLSSVAAYRHKMPTKVLVDVKKDGKMFIATVKKIDNKSVDNALIITQGRNEEELVTMLNDALLSYLDIPLKIGIKMPLLIPEGYANKGMQTKESLLWA